MRLTASSIFPIIVFNITRKMNEVRETIYKILENGAPAGLRAEEVTHILSMGADKLMMDNTLLRLDAPRVIVGDIHGNLKALLHIFDTHGYPPDTRYLFLGDYVDSGPHGVECMCLLLAYKVLFPDAVHLLRGNHETGISEMYGFYDEWLRRQAQQENMDRLSLRFQSHAVRSPTRRRHAVHAWWPKPQPHRA